MKYLSSYMLLLCCLLLLALPAIAQDDDSEDVIISDAFVNTAELDTSNETAILTITGDLPDSCTEINEISQAVEDDLIQVTVKTTRPADAACATILDSFDVEYTIDTSDLDDGVYAVDVNGIMLDLTLPLAQEEVEFTCPEADEETVYFEDLGLCFVYPSDFDLFSGDDFIFISQPLTSNAVLLINIDDTDETTLDNLRDSFEEDDLLLEDVVIGTYDTIVIDNEMMREAYTIVDEHIYHFIVQPLTEDDNLGEILWATVLDSVYFPSDDELETND